MRKNIGMQILFGIFVPIVLALFRMNGTTGHRITAENPSEFSLRIIHTNDMHARFEETSVVSSKCAPSDVKANKCYGGFARIATLVRQARNSTMPTLFLNAGDTYQGTVWYSVHKWKIVSKFLNILSPDAMSLGNHEFDDGVAGLVPFLKETKYPVVAANLDLTEEPRLAATDLRKSTILVVNGTRIGIIGYLTPDTRATSATGKVKFLDEVESIRREAVALSAAGVKILIALGHSGYEMDKRIATEVDGIDIVIGGHTNTFLHTGDRPDVEEVDGFYPTTVTQKSGRKVYVVQAYAYTKYVGNLTVNFDTNGEVTKIRGNPTLVNGRIEQAKDVLDELEKWRPQVAVLAQSTVGTTKVYLENSRKCRREECNLGNLVTDALVDYNAREFTSPDAWTDAAIAIYNSGSIRSFLRKPKDGKITKSDVLSIVPFNNVLWKVTVTGSMFREILEKSVYTLEPRVGHNGRFLQFSGVKVVYDITKPAGSKLVSAQIRCADCNIPSYADLSDNARYTILLTDFLGTGGDGYSMLKNLSHTCVGVGTDEVLADYLQHRSPVYPAVEGRISYMTKLHNYGTPLN